jgi:hypothetical protein
VIESRIKLLIAEGRLPEASTNQESLIVIPILSNHWRYPPIDLLYVASEGSVVHIENDDCIFDLGAW